MLSKKLGILFLAGSIALVPLYTGNAFAETAEQLRSKLSDIEQQKQKLEARKAEADNEAAAAKLELGDIMNQLQQLKLDQSRLEKRTSTLQGKINANQAKLEQKKAEMAERNRIYKKRLRDIYINGSVNYLDVLLGAKDFGDFSSRMYLLQKIIKSDLSLIDKIKAAAAEISARQQELDGQMQDLRSSMAVLNAKKAKVTAYRRSINGRISKAEQVKADSNAEIDRLQASVNAVTEMLRNMESSGSSASQSSSSGGSFMWPCQGPITSYFGWRTHPIFGTTKYHSGMDIAVDTGTPIHATNNGTVVYSGWLGGYGYCVMIDHGGGLVSLYGHNSSLTVNEGQRVSRGTVIAYAGSTGYSTGPHCHFEMRLHGEVTEPLNYLP